MRTSAPTLIYSILPKGGSRRICLPLFKRGIEGDFNALKKIINRLKTSGGFTLVEALFSVALLGLMASGITTMYISGLQSLEAQSDRALLESRLRGRMEELVGRQFDLVTSGTTNVTVRGTNYTINWTAAPFDINGDAVPDSTAKLVTLSVAGITDLSLTTILVNYEDNVGKI